MTIAYLYYDLLNLYGESGNIKMLTKAFKELKIKAKFLNLSLEDELDFSNYDLVYIASGTEENQKLALSHLLKYKQEIKQYIENNKFMLVTGNSLDLFGKSITTLDGQKFECLNIFDYEVIDDKRVIGEAICDFEHSSQKVIGFENHQGQISNNPYPLFKRGEVNEGIYYNNFIGTYLLGPILVRNPHFLVFFLEKLLNKKVKLNLTEEKKAYNVYVKNYGSEEVRA